MPKFPDNNDPENWHRYFAVECNNRGWALVENPNRSLAEADEMLHAGHAAAYHWSKVGNDLNNVRAQTLLAEIHALRGFGASAVSLSTLARDYFLAHDTEDWEIAFAHTIHAHACFAANLPQEHRKSFAAAKDAIASIQDDENRNIVLKTFNQVPEPS